MPDLGILEILIAFFLFLPLTENYVKTFHSVDGLAFFPPIAFFCALAIFPAYGFRVECIPLLLWTFIYTVINFPALSSLLNGGRFRDYSGRGNVYVFVMIMATGIVTGTALYFLPVTDTHEFHADASLGGVDNSNGNEYFINVYNPQDGAVNAEIPLVIVVPPLAGSVPIVDGICGALRERGVRVVSFSRGNLDIPIRTGYPEITLLKKYWTSIRSPWKKSEALDAARSFEKERMRDIEFVLPLAVRQFNSRDVYIAAYNEGASAAIALSASSAFISAHPQLKGIIAIEGRLYTNYTIQNERAISGTTAPENIKIWQKAWRKVQMFFKQEKKIIFVAGEKIAPPELPLLLINAGRNETNKDTAGPYAAIDALIASGNSFVQVRAIAGAGIYDYSDVPGKYPVISFFTRGAGRAISNKDMGAAVTDIMSNFIRETQGKSALGL
jgi:hypothetical protein